MSSTNDETLIERLRQLAYEAANTLLVLARDLLAAARKTEGKRP